MEEVELNCLLSHILRSRGVSLRESANNHITVQPNKMIAEKIIKRENGFTNTVNMVYIDLLHQSIVISHFSKEHTVIPSVTSSSPSVNREVNLDKKIIETYQVRCDEMHYVRREEVVTGKEGLHSFSINEEQKIYILPDGYQITDGIDCFEGYHTFKKILGDKKKH